MTEETIDVLERIGELQRNLTELRASLTQKWTEEAVPDGEFDIFVCRAGEGMFGLPIEVVKEVLPICQLTDYPQGPPWLAGLINLRGELIPVVDVYARINRQSRPTELSDAIVIVQVSQRRFGLVFQEVFRIHNVDGKRLQPPLRDIPEALYVLGIVETEETPVFLLSLACLLGTSEIPEDLL
jgi:purine-binding chemotaxis protein CheW